ncbi:beta-ketoacyl synthase N-terminal-like domain-containing protein [Vibrio sp. VPAP30]|uniref:beta-ketoacyl synthase N-terminal-like domain-containing protein n=1 Tax=Vibrio sp. VPAP30 TaxID=1647102 RepID=UPI0006760552|nr:beta-ketoacyl synthase N-terminal-like domain-containing protein [Vibrio sp. VPAP30]
MITLLAGEVLGALGNNQQQIEALRKGEFFAQNKTIAIFEEQRTIPYYAIRNEGSFDALFDPVPHLTGLIDSVFEQCSIDVEQRARCGLFVGCASNDLSLSVPLGESIKQRQTLLIENQRVGNGRYAARLSHHFGLSDFSLTYNTACTSSSNALLDAATMLESQVVDYALVVGIETFAEHSIEGFVSMQLLAPESSKPFDANRNGLLLGESLSVVLMSRSDVKSSPWHFLGGDSRCETHSVTGVNPDGSGIAKVISQALDNAKVTCQHISAIKAHGTASYLSDLAEINGMKSIFETPPPFFSLKPYIGHTLGSCGTSELVLMMNAIDHGFIPPTPNFSTLDPEMIWAPTQVPVPCEHGTFLVNCFGFGGNNNAFVIEKKAL